MYHGTPLESALQILKEGYFRGTKKLPEHQHAYISFSSSFESSKDFGEIVFTAKYNPIYFTEVEYDSREWLRNNREIVEYIGVWYDNEERTEEELHAIQFEQEYVIKDCCPWKEIVTDITIYAKEGEDVQETQNRLAEVVGDTLPIHIKRWEIRKPSPLEEKYWNDLRQMVEDLEKQIATATK